jgi:hypothetical protein
MHKGDKVIVNYAYNERKHELRHGTAQYISKFGWAAVRFSPGYVECIWRSDINVE